MLNGDVFAPCVSFRPPGFTCCRTDRGFGARFIAAALSAGNAMTGNLLIRYVYLWLLNLKRSTMSTHVFYKYQGAGNDFVVLDNRDGSFDGRNVDLVRRLCDRRFGIGGDGLMLLQTAEGFDFEMVYYNAGGQEGSMCGNGGRCIVAFARDLGIIDSITDFLVVDGPHRAQITGDWVSLKMIDVSEVTQDGQSYVLNTGSPNYVREVEALESFAVVDESQRKRYSDAYRESGINVNFVQPEGSGFFVR